MAEMSLQIDVMPILSKYKKIYFISYKFVFNFTTAISKHHLFLKLTYKPISQPFYKYKLLKFPLDCGLDKELSPILLDLYQKNTDLEIRDHKITRKGILKNICLLTKKSVKFNLPPIEEEIIDCHKSPLRKYLHPKLCSYLMNPRHPDK